MSGGLATVPDHRAGAHDSGRANARDRALDSGSGSAPAKFWRSGQHHLIDGARSARALNLGLFLLTAAM